MHLRTTLCLYVLAIASAAALAQNGPPQAPAPQAPAELGAVCASRSRRSGESLPPGRSGKLYCDLAHQADGGRLSQRVLGIRPQPLVADPGYPADARRRA